ncbi:hypothetical protein [Piscinibacter gummiphilus]|uniref:CPBP family intramembrane metalloprotease n=1 Tax=Piscinibacter gummiphilus TaxID=946333 RepID=A0ABZ0CWY0_9BURK|nr:hypothetical protein [Piscinibacter gummiphilus]WOB06974.1 hypothetical protein RXV79_18855 [Piscinibacter gummiphilus]
MTDKRTVLVGALGVFILWSFATWLLEGRMHTLLRPDAVVDRIVYALVGNLLLGVSVGLASIVHFTHSGAIKANSAGLGSARRTLAAVAVGLGLGLGLYVLLNPPTMNPVVMLNAFSQVFVVSAAEVVVCWAVIGAAAEASFSQGWTRILLAALTSSVLFGLYHFAHSPPFNTWGMVGFLTVVGLGTSTFFFASRDVLGTAVFHNFLGMLGVLQALANAGALGKMQRIQPMLLGTAVLCVATVLLFQFVILRRRGPQKRVTTVAQHTAGDPGDFKLEARHPRCG